MRLCRVLVLGCTLLALGCAARRPEDATQPASYVISPGGRFTIELPANPSTGYQWQLGKPLEEEILELIDNRYQPLEAGRVGAGGADVWTFAGVGVGRTTIDLVYVRPWERGIAPAKRAIYSVDVR
jgi:inhibitor of cysteine peptidase